MWKRIKREINHRRKLYLVLSSLVLIIVYELLLNRLQTTTTVDLDRSSSSGVRHVNRKVHQERVDIKKRVRVVESEMLPNLTVNQNSVWVNQTINTGRTIFLYSAYYDGLGSGSLVRVLGAAPHRLRTRLTCLAVDRHGYTVTVEVDVRQNKEHWSLPFSSYYFNCLLRGNFKPSQVAVQQEGHPNTQNSWIKVQYSGDSVSDRVGRMGVCVKPLYRQYDRAVWLVEFIEMYRLLGVTDFILYNHSVGHNVERVLRYYQAQEGLNLQVLLWNLPIESQMKIRTEAQFTALNDCNFRMVHRVKYAAMVDVDEFLIPNIHDNLTSLLNQLNRPQIASFSFQNVFFYLYWGNSSKVEDTPGYLLTQYKTTRLQRIHRHGSRSKYVVKPENVVECGNHNIWLYRLGKRQFKVNETLGLSHHYRICEYGGYSCTSHPAVTDERALHWSSRLLPAVSDACSNIFTDTRVCPPAPSLGSPY